MPYIEPDPISFLEQMIYCRVIKPYADLTLMDMETQPCAVQAYKEHESDIADGLSQFLMPSSRMCVFVHMCVPLRVHLYICVYI